MLCGKVQLIPSVFLVNGVKISASLSGLKAVDSGFERRQTPAETVNVIGHFWVGEMAVGFVAVLIMLLDNQRLRLRCHFDTELHFSVAESVSPIQIYAEPETYYEYFFPIY